MPRGPLVACATMQLPANPAQFFRDRFGLSDAAVERVLGGAVGQRADWADAFFEYRVAQTASLEDGVVKKATRNVRQGVGVRVLAGPRTGFAYSDEVTLERLEVAARTAQYIADRQATAGAAVPVPARAPLDLYAVDPAPVSTPLADQIGLLERLDAAARAVDPAITSVIAGIGLEHRVVLVATASGLVVGDVRPLVHLSITCIAEDGGGRQQGTYGGGGRQPFAFLTRRRPPTCASPARRPARPAQPRRRRRPSRRR